MENYNILFELVKNENFLKLNDFIKNHPDLDLNIKDNSGNYLITYAIIKNNIQLVKLLIENECKIDIIDQEGRSILYFPIKYDYFEIIELILKYNTQNIGIMITDFKDTYNNIPLHYAIFFKNEKAIDLLLKNDSNTNTIDENGYTSLHLSIYTKNYNICKKILDHNFNTNINAKTINGETALHIACNLELENIVELLIDNQIDINAQDYDMQLTALIYAIHLNNNKIAKILINSSNINPNIQDFTGNTALHHAIIEENNEIILNLLSNKNVKTKINVNLYNIDSKFPIHLFLEKEKNLDITILQLLIDQSNLNFQDNNGNTPLHFICKKNLWHDYKEVLKTKKMNIYIHNYDNERPVDYINKNELTDFLNLVTQSYLYILRTYNFIWKEEWENMCNKELFYDKLESTDLKIINKYTSNKINKNEDVCKDIIHNKLVNLYNDKNLKCGESSYPIKINKKCIQLNDINENNIELCSFVGVTLDVLCGLIYLLRNHKSSCSTITSNFIKNDDLCDYYCNIGIKTNMKCEFLNFEIVWIRKKIFFSDNFADNFNKCISKKEVRFVIIPLGIELESGSHANYMLFDKKTYELERFEPYGSDPPYKFNYDIGSLDSILEFKFMEINKNIKYISTTKYLPKIGFQYYDVYESKTGKIGDPGGFCALWSIWYIDNRLKYPEINRKSLIKKLLKEIKSKKISFKNLIRNYSINITTIRDDILKHGNITINDWINDQYTEKQYIKIINKLTNLLKNIID